MSVCVFSCLWVFWSIKGRKHPIAAACLFPLAIFSYRPCQGPHIHPPTVGSSSSLRYNGPWQTVVINPCRLFIQPMKNTCSPLMLPAESHMSKIHNPGNVIWYLVGSGTTWWLPGALQLGWTLYHAAMHLLNPASKPTSISASISLYLFSLATAINQMALKRPFKQIHAQMLCCLQYCSCSQIIMIDYYSILF